MNNKQNRQWKNELILPLLFSICFLYAALLKQPFLLLLGFYFLGMLCYKKQLVLLLIGAILSLIFFMRVQQTTLINVPEEKMLQLEMQIFPDTIQLNGDLISFEAQTTYGKVKGQYQANSQEELTKWASRHNWNQVIVVNGLFREKAKARNMHGFNQETFLYATGFLGYFKIDEILSKEEATKLSFLRKTRARWIDWIEENFPPKLTVYLWALLLGYRDQSFQELREVYSGSGILHFFTISGMHIYLFYGWLFFLFRRSRLTFSEFAPIGVLIVLFGIVLFGQGISVLRASILYLLNLILRERRIYLSGMDRFSIVLMILLWIDPKTFIQLSGILSIGISWLLLLKPFSERDWHSNFKQSQVVSCLAAPVFMYFFFELPLLSGLLTTICAPFFSFFLLPVGVSTCLLKAIGINVSLLTNLLLNGITVFETILSYTKTFVLITGQPPLLFVCITLIVSLLLYQSNHRRWLFVPLMILVISQCLSLTTNVSFVDVGQGDSIVLQSPMNKEVYVVDTGGKLSFEREDWQKRSYRAGIDYTLLPFLKGEGIKQIDGLFLTHGDADHMGDALRLIQAIPVKWIYVGKGSLEHPSIQRLIEQLPSRTQIREVTVNEVIGQHIPLQVLAPQHIGKGENEDSIVLATTIYQTSLLMTGDLGKEGEQQLLERYPELKVDIMKLGHHGSRTSTDEKFIEAIQLKHGIISCGQDNRFKHPHPEVLETLESNHVKVYRTDQQGMIRYSWRLKAAQPTVWVANEN